jgi:hypothetical protein
MKTAELDRHFRAYIAAKQATNGSAPRYVLMHEVADATGWGAKRKADAIVVDCWKTKHGPQSIHGYEFKTSRSDWQRELKDRSKADAVERFCHTWTVVAPEGIVDYAIPPWGLILVSEDGSVKVRQAPRARTPDPAPMRFVAALVRRAFQAGLAVAADDGGE